MWSTLPTIIVSTLLAVAASTNVSADEAHIVPEQLQRLAAQNNIANRLGINWEVANSADVGRYMGALAAADIAARTIAGSNGRKDPTEADYLSGLTAMCWWPPHKPPIITSEEQQRYYPAFYSARVREELPKAVGQTAITLPSLIEGKSLGAIEAALAKVLPTERQKYFDVVFNPDKLR